MLSGCAGPPVANTSTPSVSVEAAPTTTPTPDETSTAAPTVAVERILVRSGGIELANSDGSTTSLNYFNPTQEALDALTIALGTAPASERYAPELEPGPGITYTWPGLVITDPDAPVEAPLYPDYWITVTAPTVSGVEVETVDGIQVGDSAPAVEAAYPDQSSRISVADGPERLDVSVDTIELPPTEEVASSDLTFSVWLIAPDPTTVIAEMRAPAGNFGV
jgi:hypothetical protein